MTKRYSKGDKVEWGWGNGTASGKIAEVHTENVQKTLKGSSVKREASAESPAYTIEQDDGTRVLKSHSEIHKQS